MIQNSKMSRSSEPRNYLSPVQIQHYFSNELIHFTNIRSLKYQNELFFTLGRVLQLPDSWLHTNITCCPMHTFYTLKVMGE